MLLTCHTKYCHSVSAERALPRALRHMFLFSNSKGFSHFLQDTSLLFIKLTSPLVSNVLLFSWRRVCEQSYTLLLAAYLHCDKYHGDAIKIKNHSLHTAWLYN